MAAKAIFGGLLAGVGKGMADDAEARREAALERARALRDHGFQMERDAANDQRVAAQRNAELEGNRGLLVDAVPDEQGRMKGITRGGDVKDLGFTGEPGPYSTRNPRNQGGLLGGGEGVDVEITAGEQRTLAAISAQYTDERTRETDWQGVVSHLRSMPSERGGDRWNQIADFMTGGVNRTMRPQDARSLAAQEANARTGLFSSRKSEFPETGGDMDQWIEQRTTELLGGKAEVAEDKPATPRPAAGGSGTGGDGGGDDEGTPPGKVATSSSARGAPPGSGTRANPYQGTTQDQIDWFRQNAPEGSVIQVNGQLYTK